MSAQVRTEAQSVIERLHRAQNDHDLDAFVACFHDDYRSDQPCHPRQFRGSEQVRENWSSIFREIQDFRAELVALTGDANIAWAEWNWTGTQPDGSSLNVRGVTRDNRIAWGRLYMEPVEQS